MATEKLATVLPLDQLVVYVEVAHFEIESKIPAFPG